MSILGAALAWTGVFSAPPPAPYNGHLLKAWLVTSPHRIVRGFGSCATRSGNKGFPLALVFVGPPGKLVMPHVYSVGNGSPESYLGCHSVTVGRPLHSGIEPFSLDWHFFFISMGDTSQHFFLPVLFYFF